MLGRLVHTTRLTPARLSPAQFRGNVGVNVVSGWFYELQKASARVKLPPSDAYPPEKEEVAHELAIEMSHEKLRTVDEFLEGGVKVHSEKQLVIEGDTTKEVVEISGIPKEHREQRKATISQRAKSATQTAWKNTEAWKIELDNQERWENPNIGWASNADPLSNISMALNFASKEDAINFCIKNHWDYEVTEPHERKITTKQYGWNYSWNRRTRISTK